MDSSPVVASRRRACFVRSRAGIIGVVIAVATALVSAGPGGPAVAEIRPVPVATGYDYRPGEPTIWGSVPGTAGAYYDKACSGGFAIAGDSGFFLTTAATCGWMIAADRSIRGDAGYYADVFATRSTDPTVLLRLRAGNNAYQILVDPTTGRSPGDGRVQGWTATSSQSVGMLVGKMGIDTGWTEGKILGIASGRFNEYLICTDAPAGSGDIGGPVWRWDSSGLRALGTVAGLTDAGGACYRPIQETLYAYGAYLPSFGPPQGRPSWGTFAPGMVDYLPPIDATYAGRIIDKGDEWRLP